MVVRGRWRWSRGESGWSCLLVLGVIVLSTVVAKAVFCHALPVQMELREEPLAGRPARQTCNQARCCQCWRRMLGWQRRGGWIGRTGVDGRVGAGAGGVGASAAVLGASEGRTKEIVSKGAVRVVVVERACAMLP